MKSKQVYFIALAIFFVCSTNACKTAEKGSKNDLSVDTEAVPAAEIATMNKDAIRLKGRIDAIEAQSVAKNIYIFTVEEIVKYGATFATLEPKVGEKISISTPSNIRFSEGESLELDVKTPLKKTGILLNVTLVQN